MSEETQPLSFDPGYANTLSGVLHVSQRNWLMATDDMLPARVLAYDRAANRAQVQPTIVAITTLGELLPRAQIASVPVLQLSGGGAMISFNIAAGDLGWLKACDRDISIFKQTYAQSVPNTKRLHSFEDGMFIPDAMKDYVIAAEDVGNAVFQTKDGAVCIAVWPSQLKITAPNSCITDTKSYAPNPNAVLDVQSTTRAFKVPSMTTAERDAISSPTGGMIVYLHNFTPTPKFSFYTTGVGWS